MSYARTRVIACGFALGVLTGCASTGAVQPTHRWVSTDDAGRNEYVADHRQCAQRYRPVRRRAAVDARRDLVQLGLAHLAQRRATAPRVLGLKPDGHRDAADCGRPRHAAGPVRQEARFPSIHLLLPEANIRRGPGMSRQPGKHQFRTIFPENLQSRASHRRSVALPE